MSALEKHYSTVAVGKLWSISPDTVRSLFRNVPGVVKIVRPETRFKRKYCTYLIPESVLQPLVNGIRSSTPQSSFQVIGAALETTFPEPGEAVLLAGYPLSERNLILQTGTYTGLDFFENQNATNNPKDLSVNHTAEHLRIMLSLVSNPGNSGGPVFNDAGKIIGLLEGNLPSPIRDENGIPLFYMRQKKDASGKAMLDDSGKPIVEQAPYLQNSGISLAVPAEFILKLAQQNKISLD